MLYNRHQKSYPTFYEELRAWPLQWPRPWFILIIFPPIIFFILKLHLQFSLEYFESVWAQRLNKYGLFFGLFLCVSHFSEQISPALKNNDDLSTADKIILTISFNLFGIMYFAIFLMIGTGIAYSWQASKVLFGFVFFTMIVIGLFPLLHEFYVKAERQTEFDRINQKFSEGGQFVVYLRPFKYDGRIMDHTVNIPKFFGSDHIKTVTIEERIAVFLYSQETPFISLGDKNRSWYGAMRVETSDERWREELTILLQDSAAIICIPGAFEGTLWEVNHIIEQYSSKSIFVMPPLSYNEDISLKLDIKLHWESARISIRNTENIDFPVYEEQGMLIQVNNDGRTTASEYDDLIQRLDDIINE